MTAFDEITDAGLPCVLVGGWAVTAFNQRISIDIDFVVSERAVEAYESFLRDHDHDRPSEHHTSGIPVARLYVSAGVIATGAAR